MGYAGQANKGSEGLAVEDPRGLVVSRHDELEQGLGTVQVASRLGDLRQDMSCQEGDIMLGAQEVSGEPLGLGCQVLGLFIPTEDDERLGQTRLDRQGVGVIRAEHAAAGGEHAAGDAFRG
jgi:hypothetical protein